LLVRPNALLPARLTSPLRYFDDGAVLALLPPGIDGHFGPELRRFVLAQYHQG
jgi:hypothetical protein